LHQVEKLGLETIEQRSRSDLLDRCGWWLAKLLEFSLPPGQLPEIGCSHGGLLGLAESGISGDRDKAKSLVVGFRSTPGRRSVLAVRDAIEYWLQCLKRVIRKHATR
jgi:hypothetical protein